MALTSAWAGVSGCRQAWAEKAFTLLKNFGAVCSLLNCYITWALTEENSTKCYLLRDCTPEKYVCVLYIYTQTYVRIIMYINLEERS